jgi:hypothetical protein
MTDLCGTIQFQAGHQHTCLLTPHGEEVQHKCVCGHQWSSGSHATSCPKLTHHRDCTCGAER